MSRAQSAPTRGNATSSVVRLSENASRKLAFEILHPSDGRPGISTYAIYLALDYPKATIYRWMTGSTRIPVDAAREIIAVVQDQVETNSLSRELATLIDLYDARLANLAPVARDAREKSVNGRDNQFERFCSGLGSADLAAGSRFQQPARTSRAHTHVSNCHAC